MVFGSYLFLFAFLPVVVLGWWVIRPPQWRLAWLTLVSYFFYCWWDWRYLPLLLVPTVVDHLIQRRLAAGGARDTGTDEAAPLAGTDGAAGTAHDRGTDGAASHAGTDGTADGPAPLSRRGRRGLLIVSIVVDLGLLGFFKYAGFFMDSLDGIASWFGLSHPLPVPNILLPLGISFYIFTTIAATVDVYRGTVAPARNLLHYACYIALFPKLVSGPITRLSQIEPQLERLAPRLTWQLTGGGLFLIACGLFKKLLIADQLAPHVNGLFAAHNDLGLAGGWAAAVGYTLQLYFDFSGYTDVAIGVGLLLGLRLPQNFDSPYQSVSIQDFWRRWHMTLSFWLRDYLYIPLGGNRKGQLRTYVNYIVTFLLGGLWHGAGWTFVLWGGMHGAGLAGHKALADRGWTPHWTWLNRLITFVFVAAAWVLFRAASIGEAGDVYAAMLGLRGFDSAAQLQALIGVWFTVALAGLLVFVNVAPSTARLEPKPNWRYATFAGLMLGAAVLAIAAPSPFLYFQF